MADKRMFTKRVTDSDAFIEMPSTTQSLYFHLNQAADDDGFNNQIQVAMMKAHASTDDLKILLMKNFVIRFESGVIVIKHWRMHNTLRKDRYTPTAFKDELALLNIKENQAYTMVDDGCQTVAKRLPQYSIDKISIDKDSIDICGASPQTHKFTPPTVEEIKAYCTERQNRVDSQKFHDFYTSKGWMVGKNKMKDWKAAVRNWEKSTGVNANKPANCGNFQQRQYSDDYFDSLYENIEADKSKT